MLFKSLIIISSLCFASASFAQPSHMCTNENYTAYTDGTTYLSLSRKFIPPMPTPLMYFECNSAIQDALECQLPGSENKIIVTFKDSKMEIQGLNSESEIFNCFEIVPPR